MAQEAHRSSSWLPLLSTPFFVVGMAENVQEFSRRAKSPSCKCSLFFPITTMRFEQSLRCSYAGSNSASAGAGHESSALPTACACRPTLSTSPWHMQCPARTYPPTQPCPAHSAPLCMSLLRRIAPLSTDLPHQVLPVRGISAPTHRCLPCACPFHTPVLHTELCSQRGLSKPQPATRPFWST